MNPDFPSVREICNTDTPLLIKQSDTDIPLFDTLQIHAEAAVAFVMK